MTQPGNSTTGAWHRDWPWALRTLYITPKGYSVANLRTSAFTFARAIYYNLSFFFISSFIYSPCAVVLDKIPYIPWQTKCHTPLPYSLLSTHNHEQQATTTTEKRTRRRTNMRRRKGKAKKKINIDLKATAVRYLQARSKRPVTVTRVKPKKSGPNSY